MPEPKTRAEITREIQLLAAAKLALKRRLDAIDARNSIQAQINVLDLALTSRSFLTDEEDVEALLTEDASDMEHSSAIDAFRWARGDSEPAPSEGWQPLLKP